MHRTVIAIACALLVIPPTIHAQSSTTPLGIWRGTLDGVPSVTLTLADDSGELGGTIVFYSVDGERKRALSIEPHTLLHPKLAGNSLAFAVRRPDGAMLDFTVLFAAGKAQIHCLNCGPDAPTADLAKDTL
jgi:hypothetical protein